MRYLGGKSRTWKDICAFLEGLRKPGQPFIEPFCGACWITQGMTGERYASDANPFLMRLHRAVQDGWVPPTSVSKEEYDKANAARNVEDPLTAFIGFGCSFSGKWFGGYARDGTGRNYAKNAANSILKKASRMGAVSFCNREYIDVTSKGYLVYCDPPYASTTGYDAVADFNSEEFWDTMRGWVKNNTVVVSEYVAPPDFVCVKEILTKTDMRTKIGKEPRIEKLFMHESQADLALI